MSFSWRSASSTSLPLNLPGRATLVDTNILLRTAVPNHPMYADAVNATNILLEGEGEVCIIPQILIELAMLAHGLTHILTFNNRDFARYAEVTAVHPQELRSPS